MTAHLIHIGYPKAGSNAVRRWLAAHPEISYVEGGIAGFRDVHELVRESALPPTAAAWRATSSELLASPRAEAGDSGGDYAAAGVGGIRQAQARVCATLQSVFPNAHILIVTRGFRGMARSAFAQFIRSGGDPARFNIGAGALGVWDYGHVVGLYREAFPGRVVVLPYELMRDDAGAFFGELAKAFGVSRMPPPAERANMSPPPQELLWYARLTRLARAMPIGDRGRARLLERYIRGAHEDRLRPLVRLLHRLRPKAAPLPDPAGEAAIDGLRGQAECLRGHPLYAPYSDDYLL